MREYKKEMRMREENDLVHIECDWCHVKFDQDSEFDGTDIYAVDEFTLKWKTGENYPEGGTGEELEIELCHVCRVKMKDMLTSLGIKGTQSEYDW